MSREKSLNQIESLIRKLDDPGDTIPSYEKMSQYENSLWKTIDDIMPHYLYKYRTGDKNHLNALENQRLYLSKPSDFNDPTESMAFIDTDLLVKLALNLPSDTENLDFSDEDLLDDYITKRTELMNTGLSYIQANRKRVKICCLSETIDSPLMWSHYADKHKGFAIRYKTKNIKIPECDNCEETKCAYCRRPGKSLYPVVYKDKRYDATLMAFGRALYLDSNDDKDDEEYPFPILTVLQKSKTWEYEREWRFVCNNTHNSYFTLVPDALFLGERIDADLACKLSHIARDFGIDLYKMNIDYYRPDFSLTYSDWSDLSDSEITELVCTDTPEFG